MIFLENNYDTNPYKLKDHGIPPSIKTPLSKISSRAFNKLTRERPQSCIKNNARDRRTQFTIIESNFIYFVTPERRVSEISENYKSQRDLQQIQYTRSVPDFLEIKKIIKRIRFTDRFQALGALSITYRV
ncbi:hypothetical protein GLOIN_2v1766413 [Rhizophagus irregularis DAOM 181602=DAOM 197198]|nr:hypothetical protein GLOIN_2v1766413 [Rhizophagus irregularis DAOM 181602=DAOM 197198]